jgi:hypothetical protein
MTAHEQATPIAATDALNAVHRRLVAVHASLAEHGPTDPKTAIPWTLDELKAVMRYIRAVRNEEPATLD